MLYRGRYREVGAQSYRSRSPEKEVSKRQLAVYSRRGFTEEAIEGPEL